MANRTAARLLRALTFAGVAAAAVAGGACSGSNASDDGGGATNDAGAAASDAGSQGAPSDAAAFPVPEVATGWQRAFSASPPALRCSMTEAEMRAAGAPSLTFGTSVLFAGYEQIGDNQNPILARFDAGTARYCVRHEVEPPDGRAYGFVWDGGAVLYAVYTVVGGGSAFDTLAKAGWIPSYGSGGGPKVTVVARVDAGTGNVTAASFVIAKKQDGKTNAHAPVEAPIVRADGAVEIRGDSAFQPLSPNRAIMKCTDYPFRTRYVLSADLTTAVCSSATNCTSAGPCP